MIFVDGVEAFKKYFKKNRDRYISLVENGQNPKALFIGCSDSRVLPDVITSTKPGDLFVVRNIGNMVPPYSPDNDFHVTAAAIEYAVSVLNVSDIIVCGHSNCGAIESLYKEINSPDLIHVKKWLELGQKAKEIAEKHKFVDKKELLILTERISILNQLGNLLTYPAIKKRVENDELFLHGWYYIIEAGDIEYYDNECCEFVSFSKLKK